MNVLGLGFSTSCFLPRTPVNKGKEKGRSYYAPAFPTQVGTGYGLKNLSQLVGAGTPAFGPPPADTPFSDCLKMLSKQF